LIPVIGSGSHGGADVFPLTRRLDQATFRRSKALALSRERGFYEVSEAVPAGTGPAVSPEVSEETPGNHRSVTVN